MTQRDYAIRFLPEAGGKLVAFEAYVDTLQAVLDGLNSLRNATAPLIAERVKWPTAKVREALCFGIGPTRAGSLEVPVVVGAGSTELIADSTRVAATFWRYAGHTLRVAAVRGSTLVDLPAACARSFAQASRHARAGRSRVELVERARPKPMTRRWRRVADLSQLEDGLERYAERRMETRVMQTQIIGRVISLTWSPPGIILDLGRDKRALHMPASMRQEARRLWGEEVLVDAEAQITAEGEIRDTPKVLRLTKAAAVEDLGADFEASFGARRLVWGMPEAEDYIKGLRRGRGDQ